MEYIEGVKRVNMRYWIFEKNGYSVPAIILRLLFLIISSPLAVFGWLNNFIPYTVPIKMTRNVKDPQFHSSFKFVISFILFPAYYLVIGTVLGLIFRDASITGAYILIGTFTGYLSLYYSFFYKKIISSLRYKKLIHNSDPGLLKIKSLHESIIAQMNRLVDEYHDRYLPENKMNPHDRKGFLQK
jgi:hypothetical protein